MNRRIFFARIGQGAAGLMLSARLALPTEPRIGYIFDKPKRIQNVLGEWIICGDGSEYFFANTAEQDRELRRLACWIEPRFPIHGIDDFSRYVHDGRGAFVCDDHGSKEFGTFVPFACVILLPGSAGHVAFDKIRQTAEPLP